MKQDFTLSTHTVKVLAKRDLFSTLRGLGLYIVSSISFLAASFIIKNYVDSIKKKDILVSFNPSDSAFYISVVILAVYLALVSASSISRERDSGTLEVLFYGPVSYSSYILGKYLNTMLSYLVVVVLFFAYFLGISSFTNLGFSYNLIKIIFISIFSVSCIVSFGLFISSFTKRVRNSIVWTVGIFLFFLSIQLAYTLFLKLPENNLSSTLIYLEKSLFVLSTYMVGWFSPFSYLKRGVEAVSADDLKLYGKSIIYCIIYSAILLSLAILFLQKRGIRE